ncbi:MAG: type II toxin-antitoxin system Phd/YefM family antitoxin [Hyphomicrobiaceae bacterium]
MREIKAGEFKAKCLALIDEVARTGEPLVITKRGKPLARLVAETDPPPASIFGLYKDVTHIVDPNDDLSSALTEDELRQWEENLERKARPIEGSEPPRKRK